MPTAHLFNDNFGERGTVSILGRQYAFRGESPRFEALLQFVNSREAVALLSMNCLLSEKNIRNGTKMLRLLEKSKKFVHHVRANLT